MKYLIAVVSILVLLPAAVLMQGLKVADESRGYLVLPGDKIEAKVLGEDEFNFTVVIDDSGKFKLPFVGTEVVAKCRSEQEIGEDVKKGYSSLLKDPMMSVTVTERRPPIPVTVSGEVRTPQRVEMRREARLLELIAFSGGFTEDAGGTVQVFRTQIPMCANEEIRKDWKVASADGTEVPSRMYTQSSIKEGRSESNPVVYPGDIIIVDKASPVYMTGEVVQQTGVYIKEGGLSLTQALAMVGGVRQKAKTKDIKIYRLKGESQRDRETIAINLDLIKKGEQQDIMLEPYDIVEVDKSKDSLATTILKIVAGAGRASVSSFATGAPRILY
ncbi:MAG: SLBB domain-containing protein [Acidobacteriota bacterium]|nr:SLBB domain-containing protein [Acidobacteriota bacterium]MDH3530581.1 SLBB domain-containing protein [Acidobacteriota bacterium]